MLKIEIDGKQAEVENGKTVMEAANSLGIYIPHFCYHKKLSIAANCRMCLVQVEKAPKPLPACATPVTDGMKVQTHSDYAVKAQKGVMEFLLINHPLDCPICDQGGECQLQDLAVGYGSSSSRYMEEKRVVINKNLGPLISTDMTRCIHCTRCVRFGQEIAGVMELGMAGRGEHAEILAFVGKTVDSEVSGNMIDLCPVGALTSKPFRYTARTWELSRRKSVSPHDGLGANLVVQVKQGRVMRVLPLENEAVNECWLSDKDRFSYEGLNSPDRLTMPMLKQGGVWKEVEWTVALEYVAHGLKQIAAMHGADAIGALATPHQTLEELFLLQKLTRALGSNNVDFRLRQADFSADGKQDGAPWLGMPVAEINSLERVLVVGSTLRKDHPLLAQRLRQAGKKGCEFNLINPVDDDLLMRVANKAIVAPSALTSMLAQVLKSLADAKGATLSGDFRAVAQVTVSDAANAIAASLAKGGKVAVLLGNLAEHHPERTTLHRLAQEITSIAGATFGFLGEAANSVGGYIANAIPVGGSNARRMIESPRKAYLLLGVEAELDFNDAHTAVKAMESAEMVVAMSAYKHKALDYADVLLPISPFTETAGAFVSTEGRVQSFNGTVKPLGDARPAWKVLRVLGNLLGLSGFEYDDVEGVRRDIGADLNELARGKLGNKLSGLNIQLSDVPGASLQRIGEVPIYQADAIVRRASSLQKTRDASPPVVAMNAALLQQLGIKAGETVSIQQGDGVAVLKAAEDDRLPDNCVRVAAGHPYTAGLGPMFGEVKVQRVAAERVA
jgi:NADH-quinone oxidoreductase subunit G